jgi:hypothetical protein
MTLRALGATPRAVPSSAELDGLDAYEQQLGSIDGNKYDSSAGYVTANVNLWPRPLVIVIDQEVFESLTPDQKSVLREAATAAIPTALAASRAEDAEAAPVLCRRGLNFAVASENDLAELRSALEPVYAELAANPGTKAAIDAITSLKSQVAVSAETPTCQSGSTSASAEASPIDGVYEFTTTHEELLATGSPDDFLENYGAFRWVLDGGRFEMTQKNGASDRWTKGSYVVRDDILEFTVEDYGGAAPDDAHERPGEVFTYTWSLYRDQLTLGAVEGAISPEPFLAKPWSRIGEVSATTAPATAIEGVYRASFTREALEQSPLLYDLGEVNDRNWGDFTLTLDRGHVTFEQENDVDGSSTSGTFRVDDDSIVLEFTEGVNAGEVFAARWSLFQDTLTFTRDETLGGLPTPYLIEPWQRAG